MILILAFVDSMGLIDKMVLSRVDKLDYMVSRFAWWLPLMSLC